MQTFLPYRNFSESAACLDDKRLGKQRVEAKQIYLSLTVSYYGWKNHPAVKMWRGWEISLATYGEFVCLEWISRGFEDSLLDWFRERSAINIHKQPVPEKFDDKFCLSHQSNLVKKNPEHYRKFFPDVPDNLPYIWPI